MRIVIAVLLLISSISFGLGISLPIVHFQKFFLFSETPSIISMIQLLWIEESYAIALAILLFSVLFPLLKLLVVFITAVAPRVRLAHSPITRWAGALSKWSMMDVMLVALVIVAAKGSGMADAVVQPGLWFYGTSAITGAIAAGLLRTK